MPTYLKASHGFLEPALVSKPAFKVPTSLEVALPLRTLFSQAVEEFFLTDSTLSRNLVIPLPSSGNNVVLTYKLRFT